MPEAVSNPLSKADLEAELKLLNQRIEKADENENLIERTAHRDDLLDERDWIVAAISKISSAEEE